MNQQAVVVIFHHQAELRWYEQISLRQITQVLKRHPIYLVCPEGTETKHFSQVAPNLSFDFVPTAWMKSVRSYNRMKILPNLYQRFADYRYMLTCELDCFVFRDDLDDWCDQGFDYIGAPWILGLNKCGLPDFDQGGNSGFSLRNIQSVLKALSHFSWVESPVSAARRTFRLRQSYTRSLYDLLTFPLLCNTHPWLNFYRKNEDRFWSTFGERSNWFRVASPERSISFSFERHPELLFDLNGRNLPFGCHAWQKYNFEFWRSHIESFGYRTEPTG